MSKQSTATEHRGVDPIRDGLDAVGSASKWTVFAGILLVILGILGMIYVGVATVTTVLVFGILLIFAGVVGMGFGIQYWGNNGALTTVIVGVINIAAGVVILFNPGESIVILTAIAAICLFAAGITRIIIAIADKVPGTGWWIVSGLLSILLGFFAVSGWPESTIYFIGILVSAHVLVDGITLLTTGSLIKGRVDDLNQLGESLRR